VISKLETVLGKDAYATVARDLDWERFSGCRIIVTGAGGFLGGALVRSLLVLNKLGKVSRPIQVVAMVRNVMRAQERLAQFRNIGDLELVQWDLNGIAVPDIGAAQYVLHAASQASPRFYGSDPVGTLLPNTVGTAALLEALRHSPDPRGFLFVSSSEVYGAVAGDVIIAENDYGTVDPTLVRACYAESKRMGETMCVAWHHQYNIPAFIVRPFHTYGPGLLPEDGRVFADFAFNVIRGENVVMNGEGTARRAFCYVSDAITGFFYALLNGESARPYNVANPAGELSVLELANMLVGLFPEKRLGIDRRMPNTDGRYMPSIYSRLIPDVTRLQSLGWHAEIGPERGFQRMIEAYT
jgi:UDP-glucuronate decarboxylase